mgnify:CR=1 FL=1
MISSFKNYIIYFVILLFLISSGVAVFYKIRLDKQIKKAQKEQIEYYEKAQKEIRVYIDKANKLSKEKELMRIKIENLNIQGKKQNEEYYNVYDNITNRFNDAGM